MLRDCPFCKTHIDAWTAIAPGTAGDDATPAPPSGGGLVGGAGDEGTPMPQHAVTDDAVMAVGDTGAGDDASPTHTQPDYSLI